MELSSSKIKIFIIFPEMELSSIIFFLYFKTKFSELEKKKKNTLEKCLLFQEMRL